MNGENNPDVSPSSFFSENPPPPEPSDEIKRQVKQRDGFRCLCCSENEKSLLQIDHINPKYYGGDHSLDNLQTLCRTCNKLKGMESINFRIHKTPLTTPNLKLPTLELPKSSYVDGIKQWEQFLRRRVNFFYSCDAVKFVEVGEENKCYHYQWQICLYQGNNPDWLESNHQEFFKKEIRRIRKKAGFSSPESIIINAPGNSVQASRIVLS